MLIERGFTTADVVSLKLINGEELIARFESETADVVKLVKPMCVTLNGQGVGLMPWMFLGNGKEITLNKSHIFAMMTSKHEAADQYRDSTTDIALR
jgi:hypothetical protein